MPGTIAHSAFSRIGQLAALPRVHAAFQWFHLQERRMMQWQQELVAIAAPPFGEGRRAEWLAGAQSGWRNAFGNSSWSRSRLTPKAMCSVATPAIARSPAGLA